MALAGQSIETPVGGSGFAFRRTAAKPEGELLEGDLELPAGGRVPGGLCRHPLPDERFAVIEGRMRFRSDAIASTLGPARW